MTPDAASSPDATLFLRFGREQQGIALASASIRRVRCLGFRHVLREDGDDTHAASMRCHHHAQGLTLAQAKFRLQNQNDECAGRKVVIDQNDLVEMRAFDLYLLFDFGLGDDVGHRRYVPYGARHGPASIPPRDQGQVKDRAVVPNAA